MGSHTAITTDTAASSAQRTSPPCLASDQRPHRFRKVRGRLFLALPHETTRARGTRHAAVRALIGERPRPFGNKPSDQDRRKIPVLSIRLLPPPHASCQHYPESATRKKLPRAPSRARPSRPTLATTGTRRSSGSLPRSSTFFPTLLDANVRGAGRGGLRRGGRVCLSSPEAPRGRRVSARRRGEPPRPAPHERREPAGAAGPAFEGPAWERPAKKPPPASTRQV
jgi:hypothetical protein